MTRQLILEHEKSEWSRLAADAYKTGRNWFGHRYSALAALPSDTTLPSDVYDSVMVTYRRWLVFGWSEVENPS